MSLTKQQALQLALTVSDIVWQAHNLTVCRYGYTDEGVRIHFVKEAGWDGEMLANAYIFSEENNYGS